MLFYTHIVLSSSYQEQEEGAIYSMKDRLVSSNNQQRIQSSGNYQMPNYQVPLFPVQPSKPDKPEEPPPSGWRRIVNVWLRLTSPDPKGFSDNIQDQERLRRARLLGVMLFLIPIAALLSLPIVINVPLNAIPIGTLLLLGVVVAVLNRRGLVTVAGILFILTVDTALTVLIATEPHGFTASNLPDLDLFLISVLISGLVLRRQLIPLVSTAHILIVITLYATMPLDPLLVREIALRENGWAYGELFDAILLQFVGGTIAWLGAGSVDRALIRANRAEELAEARMFLERQTYQIAEQKQRLEHGITILQEAQSRVANGDYSARASLQNNELFPLAISFNLMAERLNRIGRFEREYQRLEKAVQVLIEARARLAHGDELSTPRPTGTSLDQIIPVLERYYHTNRNLTQAQAYIEEMRSSLQQQQKQLARLDSLLAQYTTNTPHSNELQSDSQTAQALLQSEIRKKPLEEAQQLCNQVQQIGAQCVQKIRTLNQFFSIHHG
jgi:tetratricopeptide (TPR) repeat protein